MNSSKSHNGLIFVTTNTEETVERGPLFTQTSAMVVFIQSISSTEMFCSEFIFILEFMQPGQKNYKPDRRYNLSSGRREGITFKAAKQKVVYMRCTLLLYHGNRIRSGH